MVVEGSETDVILGVMIAEITFTEGTDVIINTPSHSIWNGVRRFIGVCE